MSRPNVADWQYLGVDKFTLGFNLKKRAYTVDFFILIMLLHVILMMIG